VDSSELATKMLEWEKAKKALDALGVEIAAGVLAAGKTQTVGNVRASYSKGRKRYDYETPGQSATADMIAAHTTAPPRPAPKTDWRRVCKDAGFDAPFTQGEPSVSLKLLE